MEDSQALNGRPAVNKAMLVIWAVILAFIGYTVWFANLQ